MVNQRKDCSMSDPTKSKKDDCLYGRLDLSELEHLASAGGDTDSARLDWLQSATRAERTATPHTTEDRPIYQALDLTHGGNRAQIFLNDKTYTLSITRAGKLILTK